MKKITIEIDAAGNVKVEAHGYKGIGCKDATKALEKALGAVTEDKDKPELYENNSVVTTSNK